MKTFKESRYALFILTLTLVVSVFSLVYTYIKKSSESENLSNVVIPKDPVPNQVVVNFKPGATDEEKQAYIKSIGATVVSEIANLNSVVVNLDSNNTALPESTIVAAQEPDYYAAALSTPNDPSYSEQWALSTMNVQSVWDSMTTEQSQLEVKVAVIDSGVCANHPDLQGKIIDGKNFIDNSSNVNDDLGHGCSVAGIIAANINNNIGIAGIAPNVKIMPLKVLDSQGLGSYSNVAAAIVYAADHEAKVINLSLGGSNTSTLLENAVNYAKSKNVIVVAAAGNTGQEGVLYPAAYENSIAVGSIDQSLQRSSFSTYGPQIDIYAPGRDILTTKVDGTYGLVSGTSFAAPQVAGIYALDIALGQTVNLDGKVVAFGGNKEIGTNTPSTNGNSNESTSQTSNIVFSQQAVDLNSSPIHMFWPFDTLDWALTGNGHSTDTHHGADELAEDWNRINGANDCNQNFNSPFAGIVIASYFSNSGYGNTIIVRSSENPNIALRVAHLNLRVVSDGDSVTYGQKLGEVGNSGTSNCHAHMSLYKDLDQTYNGQPAIENLIQHHEFATSPGSSTQFAGEFKLDGQVYGSVAGYVFLPNASGAVARSGYVYLSTGNQPVSISVPINYNGTFNFSGSIYPGGRDFVAVSNGVYGYGHLFVNYNTSNQLNITLDGGVCSAQATGLSLEALTACTPPVSSNTCPNNQNGKYCGVTLGINDSNLYQCTNGNNSLIQQCSNGCSVQAQGTADFCSTGSSTSSCPNGQNGMYCGSSLGLTANKLYNCQNGVKTETQTCSNGCIQKPPGTADVCRGVSTGGGTCPSGGNGNYCGSTLGLDSNTLFNCSNGSISVVQQCNNGCELKPSGTPDACYPTGTGGGGNSGDKVVLYGNSGYDPSSIRVQAGVGETEAPDRGAQYKSMSIPSGWSVILSDQHIGLVGNTQCFNSSVQNLETVGGWYNSVESMKVYSTNVCPSGNNNDWVKICRVTGSWNDHQGDCFLVTQDIPSLGAQGFGNDTLKSIDIGGNWEVVLFEDDNYGARRYQTNGTNTDLGGIPFGYNTSSIQVRRRSPEAFKLYRLGDYNDGNPFTSDRTISDLSFWDTPSELRNDKTESIRVTSGYEVIICSDGGFHGICGRTNHDVSDLNAVAQGLRDGASSIQVCQGSCPPGSVTPTPLSPQENASFLPGTPVVMTWTGNGDRYTVDVWGGNIPNGTMQGSGWIDSSAWTRTDLTASANPYYWHVRSWTPMGDSGWSAQGSFRVQDVAPVQVYISGSNQINVNENNTFTALASPSDASNLTYNWSPTPVGGQSTASATYNLRSLGSQTISVTVQNTGGSASASINVNVACPTGQYAMQYYGNSTLSGGEEFTNCVSNIDYDWGNLGPVAQGLPDLTIDSTQTIYTDDIRGNLTETATSGSNQIKLNSMNQLDKGDRLIIVSMVGSSTGTYEYGIIQSISGNTVTLTSPLANTYTVSGSDIVQFVKVAQYHNLTVNGHLTAHNWDGQTGGIVAIKATGTVTVVGDIGVDGKGYRGGSRTTENNPDRGHAGEGYLGNYNNNIVDCWQNDDSNANGGGPGHGYVYVWDSNKHASGGGGGGNKTDGGGGLSPSSDGWCNGGPGKTYGTNEVEKLYFGGGGGSGGAGQDGTDSGAGGNGGGAILIDANVLNITGQITSVGGNGASAQGGGYNLAGGGGAGAGGTIVLKTKSANIETNKLLVNGGNGGPGTPSQGAGGGNGGGGRTRIEYCDAITGSALEVTKQLQTDCFQDHFSIRWTGNINFSANTYIFQTNTDDGTKLWVDANLLIDKWINNAGVNLSQATPITAGLHTVKMEYYEATGNALAQFFVQPANNHAPVITTIPDQRIGAGEAFTNINLASYGSDQDSGDTITWSYSGNSNIGVSITNNVATLTYPANWTGTENITFKATDNWHAEATKSANFTIWPCSTNQYYGQYYPNKELNGTPVGTSCDDTIDFDWAGGGPVPLVTPGNETGDGREGDLSVSTNQTVYTDTVRSAVSLTSAANQKIVTISGAPSSAFTAGDSILIIQMLGTGVGKYEFNTVASISGTNLTLTNNLNNTYTVGSGSVAQILKVNQYRNINIDGIFTVANWDGSTGGVMAFKANGTVNVGTLGIIDLKGKGYRGGVGVGVNLGGINGESTDGFVGRGGNSPNGTGSYGGGSGSGNGATSPAGLRSGGAGSGGYDFLNSGQGDEGTGGGGGGANATAGGGGGGGSDSNVNGQPGGLAGSTVGGGNGGGVSVAGSNGGSQALGYTGTGGYSWNSPDVGTGGGGGGSSIGVNDQSSVLFGSGGGASGGYQGRNITTINGNNGGNGGGILFGYANVINLQGKINADGSGGNNAGSHVGGGGGGAAGTIILHGSIFNLGSNLSTALGGNGGNQNGPSGGGGQGGLGRIFITYCNSVTGTLNPVAITNQIECPQDNFSIRWTGNINFAAGGNYNFTTWTDDGTRLWVDGTLVVDRWIDQDGQTPYAGSKTLTAGVHEVKMEYFENAGGAKAKLQIDLLNANHAPVVNQLPNQTITRGQNFSTINLSSYGSDQDAGDSVTWSYSGNTNISISIVNNVATLTYPSNWTGTENITFKATDNLSANASSTAVFTVNTPPNNPPTVSQIPGQTISTGQNFTTFDLDNYGSDQDAGDTLTWSYSGNGSLGVNIDTQKVVTITIPNGWTGSQSIMFTLTDAANASANSTATFTVSTDACVGQFTAQYFNNQTLTNAPVLTRCEDVIDNFWWGTTSPDATVNADNFSTRWIGNINFAAGNYTFHTNSDNGIRVWIDGALGIDNWTSHSWENNDYDITLSAGTHNIKVEYYEATGDAVASLTWYQYGGNCNSVPTNLYCIEFFNNSDLSGSPVFVTTKRVVDSDWGQWGPGHGITNDDSFSIRWTGNFSFNTGTYKFDEISDDGARIWLDNQLVIDDWGPHGYQETAKTMRVNSGTHKVKGEFREIGGNAIIEQYFVPVANSTPVVTQIPSQTVTLGQNFTTFDLDTYGTDPDIADSITWSYSNNGPLTVNIDSNNIVTVATPANWVGEQSVTFTATDSSAATASSSALFKVNNVVDACAGQFTAQYFNNQTLTGTPALTRCESLVQNFWWDGDSPDPSVNADNFSARYQGNINFAAGNYTFHTNSDNGIRVWVDNTLRIDNWTSHSWENNDYDITLTSGIHSVKVEYYEATGDAVVALVWYQYGGNCNTIPSDLYCVEYFNNSTLSGSPVFVAVQNGVDADWQQWGPGHGITNDDAFSLRWRGNFTFTGETYEFGTASDDGVRVWLDNQAVIDSWGPHGYQEDYKTINVSAGVHQVKGEYREIGGGASVWQYFEPVDNNDPVVNTIPGQTIVLGQSFTTFDLDNYGSDPDIADPITWSYANNGPLTVSINASNVVTITTPVNWTGQQNIEFIATDSHGATASKSALFKVNASCTFTAQYYNNTGLTGSPVLTRCEDTISNFWWGGSPDASVNSNNFSARWTGNINFPTAGSYTFVTTSDNGVRLWVDNVQKINNWTSHTTTMNSSTVTLTAGAHAIKMEYYDGTGDATAGLSWTLPQTQTSNCVDVGRFCAKYFNNATLTGTPTMSMYTSNVDYDWGSNSPISGISSNNFSARYEGQFYFDADTYTFMEGSDDGVRVWIDGTLAIDHWGPHGYEEDDATLNMTAGLHTIKVEYRELSGGASVWLDWWIE
ncbi:MAG: PA14 domain-containing protein [Candidatus Dojkabacteria bacterium]